MIKVYDPSVTMEWILKQASRDPDMECVIIAPDGDITPIKNSSHIANIGCHIDGDTGDYYYTANGEEAHPIYVGQCLINWLMDHNEFERWFNKTCPKALMMKDMMRIAWFAGKRGNSGTPMA